MNNKSKSVTPTDIGLSATVVPLLCGIIWSDRLGDWLIDLGKASEEIWRGDRLPLINNREKSD